MRTQPFSAILSLFILVTIGCASNMACAEEVTDSFAKNWFTAFEKADHGSETRSIAYGRDTKGVPFVIVRDNNRVPYFIVPKDSKFDCHGYGCRPAEKNSVAANVDGEYKRFKVGGTNVHLAGESYDHMICDQMTVPMFIDWLRQEFDNTKNFPGIR